MYPLVTSTNINYHNQMLYEQRVKVWYCSLQAKHLCRCSTVLYHTSEATWTRPLLTLLHGDTGVHAVTSSTTDRQLISVRNQSWALFNMPTGVWLSIILGCIIFKVDIPHSIKDWWGMITRIYCIYYLETSSTINRQHRFSSPVSEKRTTQPSKCYTVATVDLEMVLWSHSY